MIEEEAVQQEQTTQPSTDVAAPQEESVTESPEASNNTDAPVTSPEEPAANLDSQPITLDQLQELLDAQAYGAYANVDTVVLPNGSSFNFAHQLTLGDLIIASGIFLLLAFQVLKWLLNSVWERRG